MYTIRSLPALLGVLVVLGCGGSEEPPAGPGPGPGAVPGFALMDVNPNSATYQTEVTPQQQLTRISAWYFGRAT